MRTGASSPLREGTRPIRGIELISLPTRETLRERASCLRDRLTPRGILQRFTSGVGAYTWRTVTQPLLSQISVTCCTCFRTTAPRATGTLWHCATWANTTRRDTNWG